MDGRWIRLAVVVVTGSVAGRTLAAQSVSVAATPDTTIATASGNTSVTVVVRNTSAAPVSGLTFSCDAARQIACRLDPPLPPRLGAGAAAARRLVVLDSGGTATPSVVILRVEYRAADTPGVVTAPVRLTTGRFPKADDAASIALTGNLDPLTERDSAIIYLSLKNQTDAPVTVLQSTIRAPEFLDVQVIGSTSTVAPLATTLLPVVVRSRERVRPGKVTLLVSVPIEWSSSGKLLKGDVVLSKDVDVAVEGASGMLSLLGLPSLLFLPGALVLLTCAVLWRIVPPKRPGEEAFPLQATEFALGSVTISLLFVVVWRYLLGHADYLRYFGLQDVAKLWGFSILVGAASYAAGALLRRWREREKKREAMRRIPAPQDSPLEVLEKVRLAGVASVQLRRVSVAGKPAKPELFYLMDHPTDETRGLVAPRIEAKLDETSGEAELLNQRIDTGRLGEVVQLLTAMQGANQVQLDWAGNAGGGVQGVTKDTLIYGDTLSWVFPIPRE